MSQQQMILKCMALSLLLGVATGAQAATFYVDASVASSGNGLTPSTAKKTITEGIALAGTGGDTVEVASGTYTELVTVNKTGLILKGMGATKPIINPGALIRPSVVAINAINTTIDGFEIRVNQGVTSGSFTGLTLVNTSGQSIGIYGDDGRAAAAGTDLFTGVTIRNNKIVLVPSGAGTFNTGGIVLSNNSGGIAETATVTNNEIVSSPFTGAINIGGSGHLFDIAMFGRGIYINTMAATISGNTSKAWYLDFQTQFDRRVTLSGNTFRGGGIEISNPNTGPFFITGNTIAPEIFFTDVNGVPQAVPYQSVYLKSNTNAGSRGVHIYNNAFTVQWRGIWNAAADNINIFNNTFTQAAAVPAFAGPAYTTMYLDFERYWILSSMSGSTVPPLDVRVIGNSFAAATAGSIAVNIANELAVAVGIGPTVAPTGQGNPTYATVSVCRNNFDTSLISVRNNVNLPASQTFDASDNWFGNVAGPTAGAQTAAVAPAAVTVGSFLTAALNLSADADNDGVLDALETCLYGFSASNRDSNSNGIEDGVEVKMRTDAAVAASAQPLSVGQEQNPSTVLTAAQVLDSDGDGLPNIIDPGTGADFDGDKYRDAYEYLVGTNPNSAASKPNLGNVDNADTGVAFSDGVKMMRVFVGLDSLGALDNPSAFDVNRDGLNDNLDAVITINFALNNIPTLPFPQ